MVITAKIDAMRGKVSQTQMNALSVRLELQADCLAGVGAHHSQKGKGWNAGASTAATASSRSEPGRTAAGCGLIRGFVRNLPEPTIMGNKIVTEADRKASPRPVAPNGVTVTTVRGQRISLERGSHTRSKKNTGKRAKSGG